MWSSQCANTHTHTHTHTYILWIVKEYQSTPEECKSRLIITDKRTLTQRNSSGFQWSRNAIIQLTVHYKWAANCLWSITWPPMPPTIGWLEERHEYQVSDWLGDVWWNRWNREEVYSQETTPNHRVFPQAAEVDTHIQIHTPTRQFLNLHLSFADWFRLFLSPSPALTDYLVLHRSSLCLITFSGFTGIIPHVSELEGTLFFF